MKAPRVSPSELADISSAPAIAASAVEFPPHRHSQDEVVAALVNGIGSDFLRFAASSGVGSRQLALPLDRYPKLTGFTEANAAYMEVAMELGEQAIRTALDAAGLQPSDVDIVLSTTVTGAMVPTLEARLAAQIGLRPDVKRVPLFGLGCVAGAAGVARMNDYLRAYPDQVAVLLAVELCSLTVQRSDHSMANLVACSLFGDGAAAVVAVGAQRVPLGAGLPRVLASRSRLYPDTTDVMGWQIGSEGFRIVLSADVPTVAEKYLGEDVQLFLAEFGLDTTDIGTWLCHPGGPKVIESVESILDLPDDALDQTRKSLWNNGNMSSVSVLDVLSASLAAPPPLPGELGMMMAMGPGFCSELVLLGW
jgi:alkylresorcinol/alkylpyrone synthase